MFIEHAGWKAYVVSAVLWNKQAVFLSIADNQTHVDAIAARLLGARYRTANSADVKLGGNFISLTDDHYRLISNEVRDGRLVWKRIALTSYRCTMLDKFEDHVFFISKEDKPPDNFPVRLSRLGQVPVLPDWDWLWDMGKEKGLIQACDGIGEIYGHYIQLDIYSWIDVIRWKLGALTKVWKTDYGYGNQDWEFRKSQGVWYAYYHGKPYMNDKKSHVWGLNMQEVLEKTRRASGEALVLGGDA